MNDNSEQIRIQLIEVDDAAPLAGDLFQKSFNDVIPDFPKHFVLIALNGNNHSLTLGYVHFTHHRSMYLGGGMCVDIHALRQLPKSIRAQLNQQGGVAYTMLSEAVKQLNNCDAVFGYVGHKGAYKIDMAVGFEQTPHQHLIVYWKNDLTETQKLTIIEQANEVGPF